MNRVSSLSIGATVPGRMWMKRRSRVCWASAESRSGSTGGGFGRGRSGVALSALVGYARDVTHQQRRRKVVPEEWIVTVAGVRRERRLCRRWRRSRGASRASAAGRRDGHQTWSRDRGERRVLLRRFARGVGDVRASRDEMVLMVQTSWSVEVDVSAEH
jgi:hypothetical protein